MKKHLSILVIAALFMPSTVDAKRRSRKSKADLEEQRNLLERAEKEKSAPAYFRWHDSFQAGQIRISKIDASSAPQLRLHLSILTGGDVGELAPLKDWEVVKRLKVLLASGEQRRPELLVELKDLVVPEPDEDTPDEDRPPMTDIVPMDKAGVGLDVVVLAAGHGGYKNVEQLETSHHGGVKALLGKLGEANLNVIWYGPMLYTYRSFEGLEGELSRFDESRRLCEVARRKHKILSAEFAAGETEKEPSPPPCGLHSGKAGDIKKGVDRMRFRGKYARLFGIDRTDVHPCTDDTIQSTALRFFDMDATEEKTHDAGAFEEALRLLLRYGKPDNRKAIIVVGDGRDGFIDDEKRCRRLYTSRDCARKGTRVGGRKGRKALRKCVQDKLNQRANVIQERFRDRAIRWLPLLRAAEIRVFSVVYAMEEADGIPISHTYERERLELLSQKTGGTYREVYRPRNIDAAVAATARELASERVLTVDAKLVSETSYRVEVEATIVMGRDKEGNLLTTTVRSRLMDFESPFVGSGFWYWLDQQNKALKAAVGTVVYWIIVVVIVVLLLLLLWLFFKLVKAIASKIGKKVFKASASAAKTAAGESS